MKKKIAVVALGLAIVALALTAVKVMQIRAMVEHGKRAGVPPETVTTAAAASESWESVLGAVGTLAAVQGVTVAAELPGKVVEISFEPGARVRKGELLVRQDTSTEEARLPGAAAREKVTESVRERDARMLEEQIISRAEYDAAVAEHEQAKAQVAELRAAIGKKTIRAPFSGRLGIRQVNLGQALREGDAIVTLQSLDPIYVNFALPQQRLGVLRRDLPVRVTCDTLPGESIEGRLTAVNPLVDPDTRNVQLQATVSNPGEKLRPGLFVNAAIVLPAPEKVLAIPATAVLYAPYGDSVFVVVDDGKGTGGKALRQQFVRLGEKRGDFVAVASGLKEGEIVVSTGVFKLRNGQPVAVNNAFAPPFRKNPAPENS